MSVLVCSEGCGSKVESNRCCNEPMRMNGTKLHCIRCEKEVEVNRCCGKSMKAE